MPGNAAKHAAVRLRPLVTACGPSIGAQVGVARVVRVVVIVGSVVLGRHGSMVEVCICTAGQHDHGGDAAEGIACGQHAGESGHGCARNGFAGGCARSRCASSTGTDGCHDGREKVDDGTGQHSHLDNRDNKRDQQRNHDGDGNDEDGCHGSPQMGLDGRTQRLQCAGIVGVELGGRGVEEGEVVARREGAEIVEAHVAETSQIPREVQFFCG